MKILSILIIFVSVQTFADEIGLDSKKWQLIWSDEFNNEKIDATKWSHVTKDTIGGGYGNNELQFYTDRSQNSFTRDGKLVIQAHKEKYQNYNYTSAKLESVNKADFTYGKFSFRAKLPKGKGVWPAIWMLPKDLKKYGTWPACGEIDIVELVGHEPSRVHGTLHYGSPHKYTGKHFDLPKGDFSENFHLFELIWQPGKIRWFVDGELYQTQTDWFTSASATFPAPYDREFYLILNLAIGGRWPGSPNAQTVFPAQLEVDFARVFKYQGEYPKFDSPKALIGTPVEIPHYVYKESSEKSIYTPTGFMGNHQALKIDASYSEEVKNGQSCTKVHYSRPDNWAGALYINPANDWGNKPGGLDLSKAKELSFWAKGLNGGEKIKFGMGLLGKDKKFYDTFKIEKEFTLTKEWQEYTFELDSPQLIHIKTGFFFSFAGQGKPLTFFLDDIVYE
ncbi:MAG: glycoside hydrolase family 16 protein [Lentisphaeraceae bacterium]|nr:glycoside hydrolase family 16 protein [Lentisphaeraceae bacterium]